VYWCSECNEQGLVVTLAAAENSARFLRLFRNHYMFVNDADVQRSWFPEADPERKRNLADIIMHTRDLQV
jgi:hypothetical protein